MPDTATPAAVTCDGDDCGAPLTPERRDPTTGLPHTCPGTPVWVRCVVAETVGRQAYAAGLMRAPSLDEAARGMVADLPVGGGAAGIFAAWTRGWDAANLAAPIPED
jgi:hypothetical protein